MIMEPKFIDERYPELFSEDYCGLEINTGWYTLVDTMCRTIVSYNVFMTKKDPYYEPVKIVQIKEKFGSLRVYCDGGDSYIDGMVHMAEEMSTNICELCGKPGKVVITGSWLMTRCEEHR